MTDCRKCAKCCKNVIVIPNKRDITPIVNLGFSGKDFLAKFGPRRCSILARKQNGDCIFLEKDKIYSCRIYPSRPEACRKYPFGGIKDCRELS
ncbi:YkgJ family cysteine cluster protein [Candidatus Woesearchaeota archaeon]|nr:YkgJ family cysteine cluster protein [Candidatus Woesearchaeota archaeon]